METKKELKLLYDKGYRVTDFVIYLYLVLLFAIYLNKFDKRYTNITYTRYKCFMIISLVFLAVFIIAYVSEYIMSVKYKFIIEYNIIRDEKEIISPTFWAEIFFAANLFAWIVADNKKAAFTGENGRYIGFAAVMVFFMIFLVVGRGFKIHAFIYVILGMSTFWAHLVGILQHHGNDFLKLRKNISEQSKYIFISMYGNINVYASFICLSLPVFLALFIFAKKNYARIFSALILIISGMSIMICASDSVYLGIGAASVLIWFLAFKDRKITAFFAGIALIMVGNLLTVLMNRMAFSKHKKREGISLLLDSYEFAITVVFLFIALAFISYFVCRKYKEKLEKIDNKKSMTAMLVVMFAFCVVVIVMGIKSKNSFFVFNDKWGDYRGFIWRISGEIYSDFPISNKIFGNGNETVKALTTSTHYDEMVEITGKVYDNCHNEPLQFLLTTGLVGMVGYLGLFISTIIYVLRNAGGDCYAYASAAAITAYFAQALVCVSQPITTPLYYVFLAMAVGHTRYLMAARKKADMGRPHESRNRNAKRTVK